MKKIGIKFLENLEYEAFESFQYLLDYDFDYDDLADAVVNQAVIELDIDEDEEDKEDRVEDLEVLSELLKEFDENEVKYRLYVLNEDWEEEVLANIS